MARFFIDRPIFAWVLTLILSLAGLLALRSLPVEQYPNLSPPTVRILASYPGASAKTLENTVTQTLEQAMTGLDHLLYLSSQSNSTGNVTLSLTFSPGTDPDDAMQQVQNKVQPILRKLPQEVQQQGVRVSKSGDNTLMMLAFVSTDGRMNKEDIADYANSNLLDPLSRVDGVGSVDVFGSPYAMRIWLDPNKLLSHQLTTQDVIQEIQAQNTQVAVGQVGGTPSVDNQALNATINAQSLLQTPQQFRDILLKVSPEGAQVRLGDVARIELGSESYDFLSRFNGKPASGMGITLASGANELITAKAVKQKLAELERYFPSGLEVKVAYETTPFVQASIHDVVKTLGEAIVLVFLVMYLFMQNFRATLIPTIAVPVVLLGTLSVLYLLDFSINTLTMFAMVLAIGLLVDDAIVVVENVERIMTEEGLSPREATQRSMSQIQGALVAITLVLSAVFIPMAFFGGTTGAIYRQFSVTLVTAMVLSVLVALILTPALCATLLKPHSTSPAARPQRGFFATFNRLFLRASRGYHQGVIQTLRHSSRSLLLYLLLLGGLMALFKHLPTSFLPTEDRGVFMAQVQLPAGSTQQQTLKVVERIESYFLQNEPDNVMSVMSTVGAGPGGNGQNVARLFVRLQPWDKREGQQNSASAIVERATRQFNTYNDARVFAANPPAIPGLGSSAGFSLMLEDHAGQGHTALQAARDQLLQMANQEPSLTRVRHNGLEDTPQLQITVDQQKARALGVSVSQVNQILQTAWGSSYVNNFLDRGRIKKVYVQADTPFRMLPTDLNRWYARNGEGQMVPFSTFMHTSWQVGSPRLERYNGYAALQIVGEAAEGISTGTAMQTMAELATRLPEGFGIEWTGMSYQEKLSGDQAPLLYAISLLFVFLCLAALYESWSIPMAVMLAIPLGVLGAVFATWLRGLDNDIYFQVGLLTVMGLSAKNAILIVEFAHALHREGMTLLNATLRAARQRLRPIVMTSLAFVFGVLPMALSQGAGSASQNAVGTGVIGGMLAATFLSIYAVPLFFLIIQRRFPVKRHT